jgi:ribosomal protein L11 methyltransferase
MSASPSPRTAFVSLLLRAPDAAVAERAVADAYEAGAVGLEERSGSRGIDWLLYAPAAAAGAVCAALARHAVTVDPPQRLPQVDWAQRWKADHRPVEISPRLCVHPSFAPVRSRPERREVVIDPGAAFGTGAHESTRLALEWIDALAPEWREGGVVLDVGAGSGVLALAALALAPVGALALDLDPIAARATRDNARRNGCAQRLGVFAGELAALRPDAVFAAVFANLLRRELEPLLPQLAARADAGASVVLAGLLEGERARIERLAQTCGLQAQAARRRSDASGETWVALLMRRPPGAASRR